MMKLTIVAPAVTPIGRYEKGDVAIVSNEEGKLLKRIGCAVDFKPEQKADAGAEAAVKKPAARRVATKKASK